VRHAKGTTTQKHVAVDGSVGGRGIGHAVSGGGKRLNHRAGDATDAEKFSNLATENLIRGAVAGNLQPIVVLLEVANNRRVRHKGVAVLDLGGAADEQRGRSVEQVGGGDAGVGGGVGREGRAVGAVLGIAGIGLRGHASASAGGRILHNRTVTQGVGVEGGVFTKLLGGLGEVLEQLGGEQHVGQDDLGTVLNEGGFDRGERQIALVTAGRGRAFGQVGDSADARIIKAEETDRFVSASFGGIRHLVRKLLHLQQGERTLQELLAEVGLELGRD